MNVKNYDNLERKIHHELQDSEQQCAINRVWRLMKRPGKRLRSGTEAYERVKGRPVS